MSHCATCKQPLNHPDNQTTRDCGGDCLLCMAEVGDQDAQRAVRQEIARLFGYVGAFRREEERADKLGQQVDDLTAELESERARPKWNGKT